MSFDAAQGNLSMRPSERFKEKTGRDALFNLCPLENAASVIQIGLLSHDNAAKIVHADVSNQVVQLRRESKTVHNGLPLHNYANLYFDYRNPMFYKLCQQNDPARLAVIAFDCSVLDLPGCVLADRNASSDYASFFAPLEGLEAIRFDLVYARYWRDGIDTVEDMEHKAIKNAEALIPDAVPPSFIRGVFVYDEEAKARLAPYLEEAKIAVRPKIYFQGARAK